MITNTQRQLEVVLSPAAPDIDAAKGPNLLITVSPQMVNGKMQWNVEATPRNPGFVCQVLGDDTPVSSADRTRGPWTMLFAVDSESFKLVLGHLMATRSSSGSLII